MNGEAFALSTSLQKTTPGTIFFIKSALGFRTNDAYTFRSARASASIEYRPY